MSQVGFKPGTQDLLNGVLDHSATTKIKKNITLKYNTASSVWMVLKTGNLCRVYMSRKGPKVGQGMLDFVEDLRYDVVSH